MYTTASAGYNNNQGLHVYVRSPLSPSRAPMLSTRAYSEYRTGVALPCCTHSTSKYAPRFPKAARKTPKPRSSGQNADVTHTLHRALSPSLALLHCDVTRLPFLIGYVQPNSAHVKSKNQMPPAAVTLVSNSPDFCNLTVSSPPPIDCHVTCQVAKQSKQEQAKQVKGQKSGAVH